MGAMIDPITFYRKFVTDYLDCLQQFSESLHSDSKKVPSHNPNKYTHKEDLEKAAVLLAQLRMELIASELNQESWMRRSDLVMERLPAILDQLYFIFYKEGAPISRWDLWSLLDDKTNPYAECFNDPEELEAFCRRGFGFFDEYP